MWIDGYSSQRVFKVFIYDVLIRFKGHIRHVGIFMKPGQGHQIITGLWVTFNDRSGQDGDHGMQINIDPVGRKTDQGCDFNLQPGLFKYLPAGGIQIALTMFDEPAWKAPLAAFDTFF